MGRAYGFIGVISNGLVTFSGPLGGIMILTLGVGISYLIVGVVSIIFTLLEVNFKEFYNLEI